MKNLTLITTLTLSLTCTHSFSQTGTLDPTFGTGGIVTTTYSGDTDGEAVAVQPDGKIVVVGTTYSSGGDVNLRVVRYLSDGSIDNGFGTSGTVLLAVPSIGSSVAIQTDNKIVVAGTTGAPGALDALVARLNIDGTMDNSFGTNGIVATDVTGMDDALNGMVLQSDGKIVVGGTGNNNGDADFLVIRYNTDGTLDGSFAGGTVTIDINNDDQEGEFVLVQTDGKVLVGGSSDSDAALARLEANGSMDLTFDTDGYVVTDIALGYNDAFAGAIQSDGKIVVHGTAELNIGPTTSQDFSTIRYNPDGSLDPTFGFGGIVNTPMGNNDEAVGTTMAIQNDGGIIVAGDAIVDTASQFAMVRYWEDGSIDTTFGISGKVHTAIGPYEDLCNAMTLQPDFGQYIILVGESSDMNGESQLALARYQNTVGLNVITPYETVLSVFPNPVNESSVIQYTVAQSETVSINLYNLKGELVQSILDRTKQPQGDHELLLEISNDLPHGNYLLKVETPSTMGSIEINI